MTKRRSEEPLTVGEAGPSKASRTGDGQGTKGGNGFFAAKSTSPSLKWTMIETCLFGTYGDPLSNLTTQESEGGPDQSRMKLIKVAAFDLDGVIIRPKKGKKWPSATDPDDFEFVWRDTLKRIQGESESGALVVIFSNQMQSKGVDSDKFKTWKKKMAIISRHIAVPHFVFAATDTDRYRKPATGMWEMLLERIHETDATMQARLEGQDGERSMFVGDAAGRPASADGKRAQDHSDTDRKFALNIGLDFKTPEMYFEGAADEDHTLSDRPTLHDEGYKESDPVWKPDDTPLAKPATPGRRAEIVLFVGPPASGKTTFFARHFKSNDYDRVNQDTLKTRDKCIAAVEAAVRAGRSCVVDNTNPSKDTRQLYIQIAKKHRVPIRAVHFSISEDRVFYNNLYRSRGTPHGQPARKALPFMAFSKYYESLEPPRVEEGYEEEPKVVQWRFVGDEEAKRRYLRYHA